MRYLRLGGLTLTMAFVTLLMAGVLLAQDSTPRTARLALQGTVTPSPAAPQGRPTATTRDRQRVAYITLAAAVMEHVLDVLQFEAGTVLLLPPEPPPGPAATPRLTPAAIATGVSRLTPNAGQGTREASPGAPPLPSVSVARPMDMVDFIRHMRAMLRSSADGLEDLDWRADNDQADTNRLTQSCPNLLGYVEAAEETLLDLERELRRGQPASVIVNPLIIRNVLEAQAHLQASRLCLTTVLNPVSTPTLPATRAAGTPTLATLSTATPIAVEGMSVEEQINAVNRAVRELNARLNSLFGVPTATPSATPRP